MTSRDREGHNQEGGPNGTVDTWPEGFYIAGSSIISMNGLYQHQRRQMDFTSPHACAQSWYKPNHEDRLRGGGWTICVVEQHQQEENVQPASRHKFEPLAGARAEWIISDSFSRDRFGSPGGSFLPGEGEQWQHLHRPSWYQPLKVGTKALTRGRLDGFWEEDELGIVTRVMQPRERRGQSGQTPIFWTRDRDQKEFNVQGFRLWAPETVNEHETFADNEDELPWQIVGILTKAHMLQLKEQLTTHTIEVQAAIGAGASFPKNKRWLDHQRSLFMRAKDLLDGKNLLEDQGLDAERNRQDSNTNYFRDREIKDTRPRKFRCRAAEAVRQLENLLRVNRNFMPSDTEHRQAQDWDEARGGGLLNWLIIAHSRARRCMGEAQLLVRQSTSGPDRTYPATDVDTTGKHIVRSGVAPVLGTIMVGDLVETKEALEGFWLKGDVARVAGLGRTTGPIALRMETGSIILKNVRWKCDIFFVICRGECRSADRCPGDKGSTTYAPITSTSSSEGPITTTDTSPFHKIRWQR
jgi:hypothetical protein